jgi:hypothetical protein
MLILRYENKPFPHAHAGQPETYDGKIHQHMPGAEPPTMQNFITGLIFLIPSSL